MSLTIHYQLYSGYALCDPVNTKGIPLGSIAVRRGGKWVMRTGKRASGERCPTCWAEVERLDSVKRAAREQIRGTK